jgi:hypothetical protein
LKRKYDPDNFFRINPEHPAELAREHASSSPGQHDQDAPAMTLKTIR